jgi:hypothetical protein
MLRSIGADPRILDADLAKAEHWYRRAIEEGSDEAVNELRAIS